MKRVLSLCLAALLVLSGCSQYKTTKGKYSVGDTVSIEVFDGTFNLTLTDVYEAVADFHVEATDGAPEITSGLYTVYVNGTEIKSYIEADTSSILEGASTNFRIYFRPGINEGDEVVIRYTFTNSVDVRYELTFHAEDEEDSDTDEDSKEVQTVDEILEEQQSDNELEEEAAPDYSDTEEEPKSDNDDLSRLYGTYVDSGNNVTLVISSSESIIRVQDGETYTDEIVDFEDMKEGEDSDGLHIMARDSSGEELNYGYYDGTLYLSSRVGWEDVDMSYIAFAAKRVQD